MKGGKKDRTPRPGGAKDKASDRGAPKKGGDQRKWAHLPKKGVRPKPFGGSSSTGEE